MTTAGQRILTALDLPEDEVRALAGKLRGKTGFKIGSVLATEAGVPAIVQIMGEDGFLDLKFHDIPETVYKAVKAAAKQKVRMLNVHCAGGEEMMRAAMKASVEVEDETGHRTLVTAVTVLTSLDRQKLDTIGIDPRKGVEDVVKQLALLARMCGLDGVVCSPREIEAVRLSCGPEFLIVTPGIRKKDAPKNDQMRTMTASEAIAAGANYIVVGRPITAAPDPVAAAEALIGEVEEALAAQA